jgi:hypothetical protein
MGKVHVHNKLPSIKENENIDSYMEPGDYYFKLKKDLNGGQTS